MKKTVQAYIGTNEQPNMYKLGAPITLKNAAKMLQGITLTQKPVCTCWGDFGMTMQVNANSHSNGRVYVNSDLNIVAPDTRIQFYCMGPKEADTANELPASERVKKCLEMAAAGKCRGQHMCHNIWPTFFPEYYTKTR